MLRREFLESFLKAAGCFTVAASAPFDPILRAAVGTGGQYHFPQGLASGDPTPSTVMLWTRVESRFGSRSPVTVRLQVSLRPDFVTAVVERSLVATEASDFTLRVLISNLTPDTIYFYRFHVGADVTDVLGRTRTAPAADSVRAVRFAFASCQSYEGGFYHAWRTLLNDDVAAPPDAGIDFVLHLGDFIYEALGYGGARPIAGLPSGGGTAPGFAERGYAVTLEDYRFLYKTYLSDPDLKAARARWPFIVTWDDHEFSDDCWQSSTTYTSQSIEEPTRKIAANQAWFEFIPAWLTGNPGTTEVANKAHDFTAPSPGETPKNADAVSSLCIYRALRFGRHVDLIVTDLRSYRSEHALPTEINQQITGTTRFVTPVELLRLFDAGHTAAGGHPPAEISLNGKAIPNVRRASPPGTLLGAQQKRWFKEKLRTSTATWKLWANSVPLMPLRLDLQQVDSQAREVAFTTDSWEGYPAERTELLGFVSGEKITNFVSVTGDHHAHFAGSLSADFDSESEPHWIGAEFAVAGVSSQSVWEGVLDHTKKDSPLLPLTVFDGAKLGLPGPVPNLNTTFRWGTKAGATLAATSNLAAAQAARNPRQNRHLAYCDTSAYGIGRVEVTEARCVVELISIAKPLTYRGEAGADILRRVRFTLPAWAPGQAASKLEDPLVEGKAAFPV